MKRLHDWQMRLEAYIAQRQSMPFEWGQNDCCLFAAGAVEAITGQDIAADVRGSYSTALGARRRLHDMGGVQAIATELLGEPVGPLLANVGDLVLISIDGGDALAVCNGSSVLGPSADGMTAYGMGSATAAWRVG